MHSLSAEAPPQYLTCYQEALLESPNDSVVTLKFALFVYEIMCAWLCQEGCASLEGTLCFLHCLTTKHVPLFEGISFLTGACY